VVVLEEVVAVVVATAAEGGVGGKPGSPPKPSEASNVNWSKSSSWARSSSDDDSIRASPASLADHSKLPLPMPPVPLPPPLMLLPLRCKWGCCPNPFPNTLPFGPPPTPPPPPGPPLLPLLPLLRDRWKLPDGDGGGGRSCKVPLDGNPLAPPLLLSLLWTLLCGKG